MITNSQEFRDDVWIELKIVIEFGKVCYTLHTRKNLEDISLLHSTDGLSCEDPICRRDLLKLVVAKILTMNSNLAKVGRRRGSM